MTTLIVDLLNAAILGVSLPPAARTATANGTGVDLKNQEGQGFAILVTGAITDGTHDVKLQESKNDNTANESGAADPYADMGFAFAQIGAADDNIEKRLNYVRTERFARAVTTVAAATTGGIYGVLIGGQKKSLGI